MKIVTRTLVSTITIIEVMILTTSIKIRMQRKSLIKLTFLHLKSKCKQDDYELANKRDSELCLKQHNPMNHFII